MVGLIISDPVPTTAYISKEETRSTDMLGVK
jgi:hypothetical protein